MITTMIFINNNQNRSGTDILVGDKVQYHSDMEIID